MFSKQCLAVRMYCFVRMVPPQGLIWQACHECVELRSILQSKFTKKIWYGAKTAKLPPTILFRLVSLLSSFFARQLRVSGPGPKKKEFLCHFSLIYKVLTLFRCQDAFFGFPGIKFVALQLKFWEKVYKIGNYRTRVRSLAMLVTHWLPNSLTHWLLFSKLDWCNPGMWRCQLKTCWGCYCCWCWCWGSCWQQFVTNLGGDVWS